MSRTGASTSGVGAAVRIGSALALLLLAAVSTSCVPGTEGPTSQDGVLELRGWDFERDGLASLYGEWAICWGELLEPGQQDCPSSWSVVPVPGIWSDARVSSPIGATGIATYRLRVELPSDVPALALRASSPHVASRLWVNGAFLGGTGVVGDSPASTVSQLRNRVYTLPDDAEQLEFWLQIANYEYRGGGVRRPWLIGTAGQVQDFVGRDLLRDAMLSAITLLVGLFYLAQFGLRTAESARGYFGLFALTMGLRAIPGSISDFYQLLMPWASYDLTIRAEYLGTALLIYSGAGYVLHKVPGVMPPRLTRLLMYGALALLPVILFGSLPQVFWTRTAIELLSGGGVLLIVISYARAAARGVPDAGATLAAGGIFLVAVAHDILRTNTGFGVAIELFPYFVVVWLLVEAYDMMRGFTRSFARAEDLSSDLMESNFELQESEAAVERFVPFDFLRLLKKESLHDVPQGRSVRADLTVLVAEIGDLAERTQAMSPDDAFSFVNAFLSRMEPIIRQNDGVIDLQPGGRILALFPGGADDAVAAGRAMQRAAQELGRELVSRSEAPMHVGIGIHTGTVTLGTIGGRRHLSSGVFGTAVDDAARIGTLAAECVAGILVSEEVRAGLSATAAVQLREFEPSPDDEKLRLFQVLE